MYIFVAVVCLLETLGISMPFIMPNAIDINPAVRAWALCAFDGKHCILNGPLKDKTQVFNPQNLRALG